MNSLSLLKESSVRYEIRTTIISSLHTPEVVMQICKEIGSVEKYVLQRFVPRDELLDVSLRTHEKTTMPYVVSLKEVCDEFQTNVVVR